MTYLEKHSFSSALDIPTQSSQTLPLCPQLCKWGGDKNAYTRTSHGGTGNTRYTYYETQSNHLCPSVPDVPTWLLVTLHLLLPLALSPCVLPQSCWAPGLTLARAPGKLPPAPCCIQVLSTHFRLPPSPRQRAELPLCLSCHTSHLHSN